MASATAGNIVMLEEVKNVRQNSGEPRRRWFKDRALDLIVWYDGDTIIGFQLCYKSHAGEHALTWEHDAGVSHRLVDDGEGRLQHHKMTPLLLPNGPFDSTAVGPMFLAASADLEPGIVTTVTNVIEGLAV